MANDNWITPPEVINPVKFALGGTINLDPCSSVLANTIVEAKAFYTENGLKLKWDYGPVKTIWVNPPFSDPKPWVEKAILTLQTSSVKNIGFILPDRAISTQAGDMLGDAVNYIVLPHKRVHFLDQGLVPARSPNFGVVLYILGENIPEDRITALMSIGHTFKKGKLVPTSLTWAA